MREQYAASAPDPTLPGYRRPLHPWRTRARNVAALTVLIIVGGFYGLVAAIFPVWLYVMVSIPLLMLMGMVIWSLPEAPSIPEKGIEWMLFAFLIGLLLWPNYLAITLPGVPWITINRLITFPLTFTFLISLAVSRKLRAELSAVLAANKWPTRMLLVFVATQTYTLPFADLRASINKFIDAQTQWTVVFFVSAWVFTKPGNATRFMKLFMGCAVVMLLLSLIEWRLGHVFWRDITPRFLIPPDDNVSRILAGQRRAGVGIYRVQGTFSTSLNLAEFFAFAYSAVFFWFMAAKNPWAKFWLFVYVPIAFFVIILTDSRIGPVGTAATLFIATLVWAYRRWKTRANDALGPLILLLYPFGAAMFVGLSLTWNRLKVMTWGGGQHQASTDTRAVQWANFWPALAEWPLGYGLGQGSLKAGTVNGNGVFTLDSYYIWTFLNYGVIGGFAYYGMFVAGAFNALKIGLKATDREHDVLLSCGVMLIVFLISKSVLVQDDSHALIFMALGLICALRWKLRTVVNAV